MRGEAVVLLVLVRLGLRMMSYARVRSWLRRYERVTARSSRPIAEVTRAVVAAAHRLPGTTCLVEALVARTMLRRRGHDPVLRVGVRHSSSSPLEAHAWIECDGSVVIGEVPEMGGYAILA